MPRPPARDASTYDDIVRSTVLDPDSSVRPSRDQERAAREGFRALDADEEALQGAVQHAIGALGNAAGRVNFEVTGERVTLRGQVGDAAMLRRVEDAVAGVAGVEIIHNQVVVAPA